MKFFKKLTLKKSLTFIFLFISIFNLSNCKKDKYNSLPLIELSSPKNNQIFNVRDTILVSMHVSHNQKVNSVKISLMDTMMNTVFMTVNIKTSLTDFYFNYNFILSDTMLNDGWYKLVVNASDNSNASNTSKKIYIKGVPKKRTAIIVFTSGNFPTKTSILNIDTLYSVLPLYSGNEDYCANIVDNYHQKILMCGKKSNYFKSIYAANGSVDWEYNYPLNIDTFFNGLSFYSSTAFLSVNNNKLIRFNNNGNTIHNFNLSVNYNAVKTFANNMFLLAEEKEIGGVLKKLTSYYLSNGTENQSLSIDFNVVDFFYFDENNVIVFSNTTTKGNIAIYHFNTNNLSDAYFNFPGIKIKSVTQIDSKKYLIVTDDQNIYEYNYNPQGLINYYSGLDAVNIIYDSTVRDVIVSGHKNIYVMDYLTKSIKKTINLADSIVGINLLYNR